MAEITLHILQDEIVSPQRTRLSSNIFLNCFLEPETVQRDDYESRWITPKGEILEYRATASNKYIVSQTSVTGIGNSKIQSQSSAVLLIRDLSYSDAGNYTCEVRNSSDSSSQWVSKTIRVTLLGKYTIINSTTLL